MSELPQTIALRTFDYIKEADALIKAAKRLTRDTVDPPFIRNIQIVNLINQARIRLDKSMNAMIEMKDKYRDWHPAGHTARNAIPVINDLINKSIDVENDLKRFNV